MRQPELVTIAKYGNRQRVSRRERFLKTMDPGLSSESQARISVDS